MVKNWNDNFRLIFMFCSVVQRFKNGTYIEKQGTTIGVDFTMKTLVIDGKRIKLQIWFASFIHKNSLNQ